MKKKDVGLTTQFQLLGAIPRQLNTGDSLLLLWSGSCLVCLSLETNEHAARSARALI